MVDTGNVGIWFCVRDTGFCLVSRDRGRKNIRECSFDRKLDFW
jgi:hypothetical protein